MKAFDQDPPTKASRHRAELADQPIADESGGWLWLLADGPGQQTPADPPFGDSAMTPMTLPGHSRDHAGG